VSWPELKFAGPLPVISPTRDCVPLTLSSYDKRLAKAAADAGLPLVMPGVEN
jgi:hypothetical protein